MSECETELFASSPELWLDLKCQFINSPAPRLPVYLAIMIYLNRKSCQLWVVPGYARYVQGLYGGFVGLFWGLCG